MPNLLPWTKPTQAKATVEDPNDPALGWAASYDHGPTFTQPYAPWAAGHTFTRGVDIVDPVAAPTAATAATGGTLAAATYLYAYSLGNARSETLVSPTVSQVTTGALSTVTVTLPVVPAGLWYDRLYVYRGVGGAPLQRIGSSVTTSFVDTGLPPTTVFAQTSFPSKAALYEVNH